MISQSDAGTGLEREKMSGFNISWLEHAQLGLSEPLLKTHCVSIKVPLAVLTTTTVSNP